MDRTAKIKHSEQTMIEIETAIREEVRRYKLEFAELSPTMRELLASIYIRAAQDTIHKIKVVTPDDPDTRPETPNQ